MRTGPIIIGFDGSPVSVQAVRDAAALLAPRPALVVVVWEAGRNFEAATLPEKALELPPATLDIRAAFEAERAAYEDAERLAACGAALAREAGLRADGLAVADELPVADTLIRLARDLDAQAVVVGAQRRRGLGRRAYGGTLADLLHGAACPVMVCGGAPPGTPAGDVRRGDTT